ncbi:MULTISPECIES: DUF1351 domain-containing protein [unclassified Rhodanobacter]|uniref:DUF1351 domain-containing protein n=1 Tax=unclassified Rhodanobacter TaxID=2621553 RepID=UPI0034E3D74C
MESNTEKTAGSNLTPIAEYTETAAALADLRQRHAGVVYDVTVPKEMRLAKEARAELRGLRTGLEKKRVEIKAPALERCRLIDAEAKRITAELVALEEPIDVQIKAEEARAESERLAKLEAERLRVEAIQQKIQAIRDVPAGLVGKPSVVIAGQLANLQKTVLDEDELAEHYVTATDALTAAIARVQELLAAQHEHEAEQKRIAAEREELARIRAENERLQREAEERRLADERKAAAERAEADRLAQVERDRLAAEERAQREAEQAARDEAARAEREAQEAADRARREQEQAALQAERERQAEAQRKLDEQAAQLKREREAAAAKAEADRLAAAAKAEADRLANLGLREAAQAVVDCYFGMDESNVRDELLDQLIGDLRVALANDENRTATAHTVNRGKKVAA